MGTHNPWLAEPDWDPWGTLAQTGDWTGRAFVPLQGTFAQVSYFFLVLFHCYLYIIIVYRFNLNHRRYVHCAFILGLLSWMQILTYLHYLLIYSSSYLLLNLLAW